MSQLFIDAGGKIRYEIRFLVTKNKSDDSFVHKSRVVPDIRKLFGIRLIRPDIRIAGKRYEKIKMSNNCNIEI